MCFIEKIFFIFFRTSLTPPVYSLPYSYPSCYGRSQCVYVCVSVCVYVTGDMCVGKRETEFKKKKE